MGKLLMVAGIIILVLGGLVTVGVGLVAPMLIDQAIEDGLEDALVLTEEDYDEPWVAPFTADEGDEWLYNGPENTKAAPTYDSFYMWNITNYNPLTNSFVDIPQTTAVNETGMPFYQEVGPYVTRKVDNKVIVSTTDDTITYNESSWYLENATGSVISLTDNIVSWNPAYWAYVQGAGSELNLYFNLGYQVLNGSIYSAAAGMMGPPFNAPDFPTALMMAEHQWGNLTYAPTGLPGFNEAALVAAGMGVALNFSYAQIHHILYNDTYGIAASAEGLGTFYTFYKQNNQTMMAYIYGITDPLKYNATGYYVENVLLKQIVPGYMWQGDGVSFNGGISYIAKRTLGEWLFLYVDPLQAAALGASYTPKGLFDNDTSTGTILKRFNTGAKDIDKIWDEETEMGYESFLPGVNSYWKVPVEVAGTDATHWAPDISKDDTLLVWNDNTMRQLDFVYVKDTKIRGIETLQFHLSPDEFDVASNYWQNIAGFANMSSWTGAPIYLSTPHYQEYNDPEDVPEQYDIIVDVEPNTGAVLNGYKRLQFNVQLFNFSFFQTNVKGAYWYSETAAEMYLEPIGWLERWGSAENLPEDEFQDAKDSIDELKSAKDLSGMVSIFGLGAGLVLFAAGAAMVIIPKFAGGGE